MTGQPRCPRVVRSAVEPQSDPEAYRSTLRYDFLYSCAYCTMAELEAQGIGYQIDHYLPTSARPDLRADYRNLMYSCAHCNRLKSGFCPDEEDEGRGNRVLRPDRDFPEDHMEPRGLRLTPKTQTGQFNIDLLLLNRQPLRRLREARQRYSQAREAIAWGMVELRKLSLDQVPKRHRGALFSLRREAQAIDEELDSRLRDYIREHTRSSLLDEDPNHPTQLAQRREALHEMGVVFPRQASSSAQKSESRPSRKKRGKKRTRRRDGRRRWGRHTESASGLCDGMLRFRVCCEGLPCRGVGKGLSSPTQIASLPLRTVSPPRGSRRDD